MRRLMLGVVLAAILGSGVRVVAQVIDCANYPWWSWPCCCLIIYDPNDPTRVDWEHQ